MLLRGSSNKEKKILSRIIESLNFSVSRLDYFMKRWDSNLRASTQAARWMMDIGLQLIYAEKELGRLEEIKDIREKLTAKLYIILYDHVVPALEKSYNVFTSLMKIINEIEDNLNAVRESLDEYSKFETSSEKIFEVVRGIIKEINEITSMYIQNYEVKTIIRDEIISKMPSIVELTNYFTVWRVEPHIRPDLIQQSRDEIEAGLTYLKNFYRNQFGSDAFIHSLDAEKLMDEKIERKK